MKWKGMVKGMMGVVLVVGLACGGGGERGDGGTGPRTVVYVDASYRGVGDGTAARPFRTLREGLEAVAEGGTVLVRPGEYPEWRLVLKRGVTVRAVVARQAWLLQKNPGFDGILLLQAGNRLEGLAFDSGYGWRDLGPAFRNYYDPGEGDVRLDGVRVVNCLLRRVGATLGLMTGEFVGNEIQGQKQILLVVGEAGELRVEGNRFEGMGYYMHPMYPTSGLRVGGPGRGTGRIVVRDNVVRGYGYGVMINTDAQVVFEGNRVEDNGLEGVAVIGGLYPNTVVDLGGGPGGSRGRNVMRHNAFLPEAPRRGYDLFAEVGREVVVYARHNVWDHGTVEEVDRYDVYDDDEDPQRPGVLLDPLGEVGARLGWGPGIRGMDKGEAFAFLRIFPSLVRAFDL